MYYNHSIFLLFIGGLFSLALTVSVVFLKQINRRNFERKRLEAEKKYRPEEIGDVEAKLNDSVDFKSPNLFEELTIWGIQPLLIISFASLFTQTSELEIIIAFVLILLTLFHEFFLAERYAKKSLYQITIALTWILLFALISYKANLKESRSSNAQGASSTAQKAT